MKRAGRRLAILALMADAESARHVARSVVRSRATPSTRSITLRLKPLRGEIVHVRPSSSDLDVVWDTFIGRYHLPPSDLAVQDLVSIWDLGSNIGLTLAHFAVLFPKARILGVEMDRANAALCHVNTAAWRDRCTIIEAAVWPTRGRIQYVCRPGHEFEARVLPQPSARQPFVRSAQSVSLNDLLADNPHDRIDYMKIDVEGAERDLLQSNTEWSAHVRTMKIEVHPPYSVDECVRDMIRLGFRTALDRKHWSAVIGVRD